MLQSLDKDGDGTLGAAEVRDSLPSAQQHRQVLTVVVGPAGERARRVGVEELEASAAE